MMCWRHALFSGGLWFTFAAIALGGEGFVPLFDGKSLDGWTALPGGHWEVVDGELVGTQEASEPRHGLLVSNKEFGDFVVRLKFKAIEGNSGLYFRSTRVDHAVAIQGFQGEIDADGKGVGGLYETLGRAWVVQPSPETVQKFYKPREWNEMTVTAVGGNVTVEVNGVKTADLKDDPGARRGHLALQLHGGQKMRVLFKDVEIRPIESRP